MPLFVFGGFAGKKLHAEGETHNKSYK
jgi:hypothetical protein